MCYIFATKPPLLLQLCWRLGAMFRYPVITLQVSIPCQEEGVASSIPAHLLSQRTHSIRTHTNTTQKKVWSKVNNSYILTSDVFKRMSKEVVGES